MERCEPYKRSQNSQTGDEKGREGREKQNVIRQLMGFQAGSGLTQHTGGSPGPVLARAGKVARQVELESKDDPPPMLRWFDRSTDRRRLSSPRATTHR